MSDVRELLEAGVQARRDRRPALAIQAYTSAIVRARETGGTEELIRALNGLAQIERDVGHREGAVPLYEEAVALCREMGDDVALAHTMRHLGQVHQEADRTELAEECLVEALSLYRAHESPGPLDLANAIRPLAILRAETGEVDEARRLWTEARALYASLGIAAGAEEGDDWLARLE